MADFINLNKFHAWESLLFFFLLNFFFFWGGGGVWTLRHHLFNDLFVLMTACSELKRFSISSCCILYVVWWRRTTHKSRWWTESILLRGIHFLVSPAGGSVTWNPQSTDKKNVCENADDFYFWGRILSVFMRIWGYPRLWGRSSFSDQRPYCLCLLWRGFKFHLAVCCLLWWFSRGGGRVGYSGALASSFAYSVGALFRE